MESEVLTDVRLMNCYQLGNFKIPGIQRYLFCHLCKSLFLPYLTLFSLTGHTLILYVYFLSGTGEKRETSTIHRQSSFAVNSNTGSFKISFVQQNLLKPEIPSNMLTIWNYFKGWKVARNRLVSFWTVYLCWRHLAGSELGSSTTQVQSQA